MKGISDPLLSNFSGLYR